MKFLALSAFIIGGSLALAPAKADAPQRQTPLGYCQLSTLSSATLVSSCSCWTAPGLCSQASSIDLTCETQAIRYRDDGGVPTAAVGFPLATGVIKSYAGTIANLQLIEQTASAKCDINFYK